MKAFAMNSIFRSRQRFAATLVTALCALSAQSVSAADTAQCAALAPGYPTRPITLVIGFPPGGQTDQIGRLAGEALSARIGQPVVVENRGGAGGSIGAAWVAKAPADGYTLFLATMGTHSINASLYANLAYDPVKDFKPVAYVTSAPNVFLVHASSPVKTMADLIAAVKSNSRPINIALPGNGTSPHLSSALFEGMAGIKVLSVMYRGGSAALADVMGGRVEFLVDSITTAMPNIKSGVLRPLAVTGNSRSALLPDVPTVSAQVPGYEVNPWWGIVAPRETPTAIADKLSCEINQALKESKLTDRFKSFGATTQTMTPDEFGRIIAADGAKWSKVIKTSNIKLE